MEIIGFFSLIIVILFFSGTVVMGVMATVTSPVWFSLKRFQQPGLSYKHILLHNFPYYKRLTNAQRKEFESRMKYFIKDKDFIPRNMPAVTEEMKVMIGACATQLTFGLKPVKFSHFKKIVVYPTKYFSRYSGRTHNGEVNPNGMIVLSWDSFTKGYSIPYDGYNLGLHEMAHALRLEDAIKNEDYGVINDHSLIKWHKVCMREMRKIKKGKKTFLRRYAVTDPEEFFAVCVEEFFEQPYYFRKELPEVYNALSTLLNQDPTQFYRSLSEEEAA